MATSKSSQKAEKNTQEADLVLLANGSSGPWDIAVDESTDEPEKVFAHVEGPSVYLYFELPSRKTIETALDFLEQRQLACGSLPDRGLCKRNESVRIGTFGRASVTLVCDDEHADRCFLIVGVAGKPSLQLTFSGEEIKHLAAALRQVKSDLGG